MRGGPDVAAAGPVTPVLANRVILLVAGLLSALVAVGAVLAVLGVRATGWSPGSTSVHVIGSAMAPTIRDGDYLLVRPYSGSTPRPGDIVTMRDPYDARRLFVKRIVAGPGQTVLIRNAQVIVDGRPLSEPYVATEPWTASGNWPPGGATATLANDEYFVLGDNRNHSSDSRVFGPIRRDAIAGRAIRIVLPTGRARAL